MKVKVNRNEIARLYAKHPNHIVDWPAFVTLEGEPVGEESGCIIRDGLHHSDCAFKDGRCLIAPNPSAVPEPLDFNNGIDLVSVVKKLNEVLAYLKAQQK